MNYWESGNKQIKIEYSNGTITNSDIPNQALKLKESICSSSQLNYGACEASQLTFKCYGANGKLLGETLTVSVEKNGETEQIGIYKVVSDKPNADRTNREVVAYDAMYDVLKADVSEWYNNLTFPMTMEEFRASFAAYFELTEVETTLVNDGMEITKTFEATELSGKTVINAICELNACFGHINKNGELEYIVLEPITEGLYPSTDLYPSEDLYPADENNIMIPSRWRYEAAYEDFITRKITAIHIRHTVNDAGVLVGPEDNIYYITGNFLAYGKEEEELTTIATNILNVVKEVAYRPAKIRCVANLNIGIGESVVCFTDNETIRTYVLERTLDGVSGLTDTYTAKGKEVHEEELNGVRGSIIALQNMTNTLTRTMESTVSELRNADSGLSSRIEQTAGSISTKVGYGEIISSINQTAESIKISASKINLSGYVTVSSLKGEGTTEINGSNITTGTISADRIAAGTISVDKLKPNASSIFRFPNLEATDVFYVTGATTFFKIAKKGGGLKDGMVQWAKLSELSDDTYILCERQFGDS